MTDSVRVGIKSALADFCLRPEADLRTVSVLRRSSNTDLRQEDSI
jgi:hypothetical protein